MKSKHIWQGVALAFALTILPTASAAAATPTVLAHSRVDITGTAQGQKLRNEAVGQYSALGFDTKSDALVAIEQGDMVVVGSKTTPFTIDDVTGVVSATAAADNFATGFSPNSVSRQAQTAAMSPDGSAAQGQPLITSPSGTWQFLTSSCFSTMYASSGWGSMDTCYKIWKMVVSSSRVDWLVETYGNVRGNTLGSGLEDASLQTQATRSPAQHFVDAAPDTSTSGGCRTIPLGLGISTGGSGGPGASISTSFQACEQLDVEIVPSTVNIYESWDYCQILCSQGMNGTRGLREQLWSYTAATASPLWYINWSVS